MSLSEKQTFILNFVENPQSWPSRPVLPLIRDKEGYLELGWIIDNPDYPLSIVFTDSIQAIDGIISKDMVSRNLERQSYLSTYDMVLDGWEIS